MYILILLKDLKDNINGSWKFYINQDLAGWKLHNQPKKTYQHLREEGVNER